MEIVKICDKHGDLNESQCFIYIEKRWGNKPKETYRCKLCKKESSDKYRKKPEISKKLAERSKTYRLTSKEKIKKYKRYYASKNREKMNEMERKRRFRNIHHTRKLQRNQQKKWIDALDDNYVKQQISRKYDIKQKDVPDWMIGVKREIIRLRRKIREMT